MKVRRLPAVLVGLLVATLQACGGGGGSTGTTGSTNLGFRALWQQQSRGSGGGGGEVTPSPGGAFGPELPAAVRRVRVIFQSSGFGCCVAFDPRDPDFGGQRLLVLKGIPVGLGTVRVSGFPSANVPAEGPTQQCDVDPGAVALPCTPGLFATASFDSDNVGVEVQAGTQTNPVIEVFSKPFLVDGSLQPAPGGSAAAKKKSTDASAESETLSSSGDVPGSDSASSTSSRCCSVVSGCA